MSRNYRVQVADHAYHVTARGNNRERVFHDNLCYSRFLKYLRKYKLLFHLRFYAYVLMPNHIHLVVEPLKDDVLSRFMQRLLLSYACWYNRYYKHLGHVWQGRYFSKPIPTDAYLDQCCFYIENNPVRAGLVADPADYPWSSYRARVLGKDDGLVDPLPTVGSGPVTMGVRS